MITLPGRVVDPLQKINQLPQLLFFQPTEGFLQQRHACLLRSIQVVLAIGSDGHVTHARIFFTLSLLHPPPHIHCLNRLGNGGLIHLHGLRKTQYRFFAIGLNQVS